MNRSLLTVFAVAVGVSVCTAASSHPPTPERPRVVLLTDYWKDPDEIQAMIRFLCYANEFEIEGLIATSLAYGDGSVRPEWIVDILGDYGKVQPNLQDHAAPGRPFPTADALQRTVRGGAPMIRKLVGSNPASTPPPAKSTSDAADEDVRRMARGRGFEVPYPPGARDTRECEPAENWLRADRISDGARHIIEVVDRPDPRPVWVVVWGGAIDLAQAIWLVRHERTAEDAARFIAKLRLHQSNWQDKGTVWIWHNVPELFFIFTLFARGGLNAEPPEELRNEAWVRRHLLEGHGPLAARYPGIPPGPKARFIIKEGDSPTFMHLLAPGLSDPEHPEWGGWGGRRERLVPDRNFFVDGRDRHPTSQDQMRESYWTLGRWSEAISHDFAARLDWHVKPRAEANHPPVAIVEGDAGTRVLQRTVNSGETLRLDAAGSSDPDGHRLRFKWWHYVEPGTLRDPIALHHANSAMASLVAPTVAQPETAHLILEVTDDGTPNLTSYRRVVCTILPRKTRAP